ncbi:phage tail protein [Microcoleus sp. D3_18a_C4]|uniref:phage tail protein n=1 Tax=unclassified Microcoleus TaxID=2642155 RepID=UPI002FD76BF0
MTQAFSSELLSVNLIAQRLPEADPDTFPLQSRRAEYAAENQSLLLVPGEPSEMLVKLENLGTLSLELSLELTGDFPLDWCRIDSIEGNILSPGERLEAVLYFQISATFFESPSALSAGQVLKLDYGGRLAVYGSQPGTVPQLLEVANFNLYVRPVTRYLEFLPQIYREIDFLGRFLQIFEATFEPDVQILANLWAYLDPLTAPKGMLEFLAYWMGWQILPYLSLDRQRNLIRNALDIYRWRGTRQGLRLYLHLATHLPLDEHQPSEDNKHIGIYEFFSQGLVLGETRLEVDAVLGGVRPFHFTVCLRPEPEHFVDEQLARTIIEQEKPAFCTYDLLIAAG